MVRLSPALMPASCSSKPGMNDCEPITTGTSSPVPPSNGTPSMEPANEIVTLSPSFASAPSPFGRNGLFWSAMRPTASSISDSATSAVRRSSVKSLKSPSSIFGSTSIATE